jgi:hypothetical protein
MMMHVLSFHNLGRSSDRTTMSSPCHDHKSSQAKRNKKTTNTLTERSSRSVVFPKTILLLLLLLLKSLLTANPSGHTKKQTGKNSSKCYLRNFFVWKTKTKKTQL